MSLYFEMRTAVYDQIVLAMENGADITEYKLHTIWNPLTTEKQRISNDGDYIVFEVNNPTLLGTPENYQDFPDDGRNVLDMMLERHVITAWRYRKPTQRIDGTWIQEQSIGQILNNMPRYQGEEI